MWGWDRDKQKHTFRQNFDPTRCEIIVVDNVDVGFFSVVEGTATMALAGIYVCATARRHDIGTAILRDLIARSVKQSKPLTLRVLKVNPARHLYERMRFVTTAETSSHFMMEWSVERSFSQCRNSLGRWRTVQRVPSPFPTRFEPVPHLCRPRARRLPRGAHIVRDRIEAVRKEQIHRIAELHFDPVDRSVIDQVDAIRFVSRGNTELEEQLR
jgi:hypothetical protein